MPEAALVVLVCWRSGAPWHLQDIPAPDRWVTRCGRPLPSRAVRHRTGTWDDVTCRRCRQRRAHGEADT
jgi:hypothetical protein